MRRAELVRLPDRGSVDTMANTDLREALAAALLNTVMDAFRGETTDGPFVVDPVVVQQSFALALAVMIEADPKVQTMKDMREAGDEVARDVRRFARAMRDQYAKTGTRLWDATLTSRQ